jgi:anti-anti-sigma regulatory factor
MKTKSNVLVSETPANGVFVVRFTHPDLREQLCNDADVAGSELFRLLEAQVLTTLEADNTLVLNLGLVERLSTPLYRCLLKVRETVKQRGALLLLCRLSGHCREVFELFEGFRLFQVVSTEAQALRAASSHPTVHGPTGAPGQSLGLRGRFPSHRA